ncbi:hypothetical protein [Natronomonas gomsonensis]|uniref:DUF7344 domain-containing protein n=1 Tax=Natronomonas gomsonensis TaxID=1046043 RepID=UPI0015BF22EE|nr:hypothetical protein [Natronomonas gomsonensis]
MSESAGSASANGALEEGEIHDVLRNGRRRLAIRSLREGEGEMNVRELSEEVAARETGEDPPPRDKRQSVYVSLHQTHLPKLDDLGIVDYDNDSKRVALRDRVREIEVYMEVVPQYGLSWGEFYFGLGLLGLLTTIAVLVGVPAISEVGMTVVSGVFFVGLMAASAYHVYSQQDRVIFQRLRE